MQIRRIILLLAALLLLPVRAIADPPPPDWEELTRERTDLQGSAEQARKEEADVVAELFLLNRKVDEIQKELARLDGEAERVRGEQSAAERRRNELEAQRLERQAQFGNRARYYQEHGTFAPLGFLIDAHSLSDFLFRIDILSQVMNRDVRIIKELRELKTAVAEQEQILAAKGAELAALRAQQAAQAEDRRREAARKEEILSGLREQRAGVESRVAELEQVWGTAALPVLEAFGKSLQTVGLKVGDLTPDEFKLSLFPPGATVRVSEARLNDFINRDGNLKGLSFRILPGEADLEGSFGGVSVSIYGRFVIKSSTVLRYEPREIRFQNFALPQSVTENLLATGRLDIDYSDLLGPWGMNDLQMIAGSMVVKAGFR